MLRTLPRQTHSVHLHADGTNRIYTGTNHSLEPDVFISNQGEWHFDEEWEMKALDWVGIDGRNGKDTASARYKNFFPVHSVCVDLLQVFTRRQSSFLSPHLPKTIKDFVDTCAVCQEFSNKEEGVWATKHIDNRPPDYNRYGCVEWSHLYLGARRFWTDPWDCEPGQEHLCANPMSELQSDQFIAQCLAYPNQTSQHLFSFSLKQLQLRDSPASTSPLMRCPSEILQLIASSLPLKSAINLHASSRRLSSLIDPREGEFWRFHTLRLHGPWFWELLGHHLSSTGPSHANWEEMLKTLTASRRKILKGAEPYWRNDRSANVNIETTNNSCQNADKKTHLLPLGLQNRQRIWMCLELLNVDGKSEKAEVDESRRSNSPLT